MSRKPKEKILVDKEEWIKLQKLKLLALQLSSVDKKYEYLRETKQYTMSFLLDLIFEKDIYKRIELINNEYDRIMKSQVGAVKTY